MATTAAIIAAGAGAFLGSQSSQGGGGVGGVGFTNPAAPALGSLFGIAVGQRGKGRLFRQADFPGIFAFDPQPTSALGASIIEFMNNPIGLFLGEAAIGQALLGDATAIQARLAEAESIFSQISPFALEAAETGFRTDAGPIFDEAIRRLNVDILPQIAETVGGASGIRSFGVAEAGSRAAADLLGQASLADIGLAEAAANRRLSGIPLAGQVAGTQLALPFAFGQDVLSLGTGFRGVLEEAQARPLNVFGFLSGLGQNQQFLQQGFNPVSQTGQLLGTLASSIGSFGGGGGSNTSGFNPAFGGIG